LTLGGARLREGAYPLLFTQVGASGAEAISIALLGRIVGGVVAILGGIVYLADTCQHFSSSGRLNTEPHAEIPEPTGVKNR